MQFTALRPLSVSVIAPAGQDIHAVWFADGWYSPGMQVAHASVATALNVPGTHDVHAVPLGAVNVSVYEPAAHTTHATIDSGLY